METTYTVKNDKGQEFQVDESKLHEAEKDGFFTQVSNGKDTFAVSQHDLQSAAKEGFHPVGVERKVGKLESGVRGAAQGATLGFGDELTGAAETAGKTLFGGEKLADVSANYAKHRDEARNANDIARQSNPVTYTAGEVAGSLPAYAVASRAGTPGVAAVSGLQGLGTSEANNVTDMTTDTAKSAALGAFLAGAGKLAGRGLESVSKPAAEVGEKITGLPAGWKTAAAKETAEGGMNDLMKGGILGELAGQATDFVAPGMGAMLGSAAMYGKKVLPTIIEKTPAVIQSIKDIAAPVMQSKFGPVLEAAAKRGAQSLAVTNFLLSSTDPKYRELSQKEEDK